MRAGKLRNRITIQEKSTSRNEYHDEVVSWVDIGTDPQVWASIEPLQGREFYDARREGSEQPVRIRMRYRDDLDTTMRIVYGLHIYDIESIQHVHERGRELVLVCNELLQP